MTIDFRSPAMNWLLCFLSAQAKTNILFLAEEWQVVILGEGLEAELFTRSLDH